MNQAIFLNSRNASLLQCLLSYLFLAGACLPLVAQTAPAKPPDSTHYLEQKDYDNLRCSAGRVKPEEMPALEQKAAGGDLSSQLLLGMMYQLGGEAVKYDIKKALEWYQKAADQNSPLAENQIAIYYDAGSGHNRKLGLEWYRKAVQHGDAVAEHNLGEVLLESKDATRDRAEAMMWLTRSAEHGADSSLEDLVALYDNGKALPGKSLGENRQAGFNLFASWANQGNTIAQIFLAIAYWKGLFGLGRQPGEAVRWMTRAAEKSADAEAYLGWFRTQETDVPTRNEEAARWYRKAAEHGSALGQMNLASMYERGLGVPKDLAEAVKWVQSAADQGDGQARYHLAEMYEDGLGVPKDKIAALMWFILAREAGGPNFMRELHPNWKSGFSFYRHPYKKDYEEAERRAHEWKKQHPCR